MHRVASQSGLVSHRVSNHLAFGIWRRTTITAPVSASPTHAVMVGAGPPSKTSLKSTPQAADGRSVPTMTRRDQRPTPNGAVTVACRLTGPAHRTPRVAVARTLHVPRLRPGSGYEMPASAITPHLPARRTTSARSASARSTATPRAPRPSPPPDPPAPNCPNPPR